MDYIFLFLFAVLAVCLGNLYFKFNEFQEEAKKRINRIDEIQKMKIKELNAIKENFDFKETAEIKAGFSDFLGMKNTWAVKVIKATPKKGLFK